MSINKVARIPSLIYGTAWKKERSRDLVRQAIGAGFRGVDVACQPKHYQEDLVGDGIRDAIRQRIVSREELYVQTKFTSVNGQDPNKTPYDPRSSITEQINASVATSLRNLRPTDNPDSDDNESTKPYLDCLVLHSPFPDPIQTAEAWQAMEFHVPHSARTLGISNIYSLPLLQILHSTANVKPSVVQNRFYAATGYDEDIRAFCDAERVTYQSFWTLTANPGLMAQGARPVSLLSKAAQVSPAAALYGLVLGLGNVSVLDGTTNEARMKDDLAGIERTRVWAEGNPVEWSQHINEFRTLLRAHSAPTDD